MEEIETRLAEIEAELRAIHTEAGDASLNDEQQARWAALESETEELEVRKQDIEKRTALFERVANRSKVERSAVKVERSAPEVIVKRDAFEVLETRGAGMNVTEYRKALIDGNIRALEGRIESTRDQAHVERLLKRHGHDLRWAEDLLARSRPEYMSAFGKVLVGREFTMTEEERTAIGTLTNANGKYAVPTHLDPTVILANDGTANVIRPISRVVTLTEGNVWNGLSSAGVTGSWDTELSEVSDDTPTFAQPSITVHMARAFAQYSLQAEQDIAGLAGELLVMFADAKDRLEGAAHATGSGSGQPFGIFTALAGTAQVVESDTAATLALADLSEVKDTLAVRYRRNSSWVYNPQVGSAIKALGTAVSAAYSGDLRDGGPERILNRPVYESDDAPFASTTTALDPRLVLGDFSNYVIVDKPGSMAVETIPHMFNTTTNLPDGRRGVLCYWRTGADSVNDAAFVMLSDKTSA